MKSISVYSHVRLASLLLLLLAGSGTLFAEVSLPDIFSDHMVLQRGQRVPVWGRAAAGERVRVSYRGQERETVADAEGNWRVHLSPLEASSKPAALTVSGTNTVVFRDVLVGEVWLCSGQSNMQWRLAQSAGGAEAIAAATHPHIRLFNVSRAVAFGRQDGKLATWQPATPQTVADFSGVGYFFGLELYQRLGVPVGLVNASYGGSQAEAWTPRPDLAASEELRPTIDREKAWAAERAQVQREFTAAEARWRADTTLPRPRVPDALRDYRIAGSIYERMIGPLIPFGLRGALWYQGESNEERAEQYELLLTTMIRAWREAWGQGEFPFGVIQLPNYRSSREEPEDAAWSHLRERQRRVADRVAGTGLIVTIDVGESDDIHPTNKRDVGLRSAYWALDEVYGQDVIGGGPQFRSADYRKHSVILHFDRVGEGLATTDGGLPAEFALAGEDRQWHWARAVIQGKDRVVVYAPAGVRPVAVRYAFNTNPLHPNLTNSTGIPASPFRTDNWPGPTHGRR